MESASLVHTDSGLRPGSTTNQAESYDDEEGVAPLGYQASAMLQP
jgi:hypothetical protein